MSFATDVKDGNEFHLYNIGLIFSSSIVCLGKTAQNLSWFFFLFDKITRYLSFGAYSSFNFITVLTQRCRNPHDVATSSCYFLKKEELRHF